MQYDVEPDIIWVNILLHKAFFRFRYKLSYEIVKENLKVQFKIEQN